jgi:excisionase family DNA binding protein
VAHTRETRDPDELAQIAKRRLLNGLPLTTPQAAILAGCDKKTIANWLRAGRIEGTLTPGGHWLIPAGEIRRVVTGDAAA